MVKYLRNLLPIKIVNFKNEEIKKKMLDDLIYKLLKDIGLEKKPQKMDPLGYQIDFTADLSITLRANDPGYYMQMLLGQAPEQEAEVLFLTLMEANLLGQGTGGGLLGLSLEGNLLVYSKKILQDLNYEAFREKIEEFINYGEFWRMEIKKSSGEKKRSENA